MALEGTTSLGVFDPRRHPTWHELRAVQSERVLATDAYFYTPGPRLVECFEILHPDRFAFGHECRAWERARER